jgi:metal-sulfur cluster biosynthetic enzyme
MPAVDDAVRSAVNDALEHVADPCLAAAGVPASVVDLGLVQDVHVSGDGAVEVSLSFTEVGCAFTHHLVDAVLRAVEGAAGVTSATVTPVWTWQPGHTRPELVAELRQRTEALPLAIGTPGRGRGLLPRAGR